MKLITLFTCLVLAISTFSQTQTYALKKGFVAKGYDVVSYFNNSPQKGSNSFVTEHDGAKFKFSSQENLNTFKINPGKYIPQYGGWCAYAIGDSDKDVKINPKSYLIDDGKLYLFYKNIFINTKKKWLKNKALKAKANENWNKRKKGAN